MYDASLHVPVFDFLPRSCRDALAATAATHNLTSQQDSVSPRAFQEWSHILYVYSRIPEHVNNRLKQNGAAPFRKQEHVTDVMTTSVNPEKFLLRGFPNRSRKSDGTKVGRSVHERSRNLATIATYNPATSLSVQEAAFRKAVLISSMTMIPHSTCWDPCHPLVILIRNQ